MDISTPSQQASSQSARTITRWQTIRTSKTWQSGLRLGVSYIILLMGAAFMLVPMLWMMLASFKPSWQIFTDPPIVIPQHWEDVRAGNTNRLLSLWQVQQNGQTKKVIEIGVRRYTTIINAALLTHLENVPTAEVGDAVATTRGDLVLNIRPWTTNGTTKQVVALARGDDDTLVVADVNDVVAASQRIPLDVVNGGQRANFEI